jgi:chaperonin cofactor prefoldin
MPYKQRISTLEESLRLIESQISTLEKAENSNPERLAELRITSVKYMTELRKMNSAQWDHEHDTVDFGDDR